MSERPEEAAPGGMRGATRMHDPSEAEHDRVRRRLMNIAFVAIVLLNAAQLRYFDDRWYSIVLLAIAAMPAGVGVKVFELRFKMSHGEYAHVYRELQWQKWWLYMAMFPALLIAGRAWVLLGIWLYDFVTYYRHRPERMRHLYAVTKTIDEVRDFRAPWAWALPAIAFEVGRRLLELQ